MEEAEGVIDLGRGPWKVWDFPQGEKIEPDLKKKKKKKNRNKKKRDQKPERKGRSVKMRLKRCGGGIVVNGVVLGMENEVMINGGWVALK